MGSALPADTVASDTPTQVYRKHFPQPSLTGLTDPGWMIAYLTMRSFDLNHQTLKELLPINALLLTDLVGVELLIVRKVRHIVGVTLRLQRAPTGPSC
jgi:hypothetical protein